VVQRPSKYFDGAVPSIPPTKGGWGTSYPGRVDDSIKFAGLSLQDQTYLATLQAVAGVDMPGAQFGGAMEQFDDAGTYVRLVTSMTHPGPCSYAALACTPHMIDCRVESATTFNLGES
jgi:hypothetical protein